MNVQVLGFIFITAVVHSTKSNNSTVDDTNSFLPSPVLTTYTKERDGSCYKETSKCHTVPNATCFDTVLPYSKLSFEFTNLQSPWEVRKELQRWRILQQVPKCWSIVQPLLCSVLMPECKSQPDGTRVVPFVPVQWCHVAQEPCQIIKELVGYWPDFLQCNNTDMFTSKCNDRESLYHYGDAKVPEFNISSGHCPEPLVATSKESSFFQEFDNCGIRCHSPLYKDSSKREISIFAIVNCAVLVVILISLPFQRHGCEHNLIYLITVCAFAISLSFLMQFIPGLEDVITCAEDGTRRDGGPTGDHIIYCIINFVLLYMFLLALHFTFTVLTYLWYRTTCFDGSKRSKELVQKKVTQLSFASFGISLFPTVVIASSHLGADSLMGVCFVSAEKPWVRIAAVSIPVMVSMAASLFFIARTGHKLTLLSNRKKMSVGCLLLKQALLTLVVMVGDLVILSHEFYVLWNKAALDIILKEHVLCNIRKSTYINSILDCEIKDAPTSDLVIPCLSVLLLLSLCLFSWLWNSDTLSLWVSFPQKILSCMQKAKEPRSGKDVERKPEVVQVCAERQVLEKQDTTIVSRRNCLSLEIANNATDMSSSCFGAGERMFCRRNAVTSVHYLGSHVSTQIDDSVPAVRDSQSETESIQPSDLERIRFNLRQREAKLGHGYRSSFSSMRSMSSQLSLQPNELEDLRQRNSQHKKNKSKTNFYSSFGKRLRKQSIKRWSTSSADRCASKGGSISSHVMTAGTVKPRSGREDQKNTDNISVISSNSLLSHPVYPEDAIELKNLKPNSQQSAKTRATPTTTASVQTDLTFLPSISFEAKELSREKYGNQSQDVTAGQSYIEPHVIRISVASEDSSDSSLLNWSTFNKVPRGSLLQLDKDDPIDPLILFNGAAEPSSRMYERRNAIV